MSTHHAQTALRYLDDVHDNASHAFVHAQLETAMQLEAIGQTLHEYRETLDDIRTVFRDTGTVVRAAFASDGPVAQGLSYIGQYFGRMFGSEEP